MSYCEELMGRAGNALTDLAHQLRVDDLQMEKIAKEKEEASGEPAVVTFFWVQSCRHVLVFPNGNQGRMASCVFLLFFSQTPYLRPPEV